MNTSLPGLTDSAIKRRIASVNSSSKCVASSGAGINPPRGFGGVRKRVGLRQACATFATTPAMTSLGQKTEVKRVAPSSL